MTILHNTIIPPSTIFLKSNDATSLLNGSLKSNISFDLRNKIFIPPNVNCFVQLNTFRFVNSIYNVNSTNNKFYYSVKHNTNIQSITLTIPVGNYSIISILQYLNTATAVHHMDFTYLDTLFKVNIAVSSSREIHLMDGANNCYRLLGFVNYNTTTYVTNLISDSIINLGGTQVLYISLENVNLSSNTSKQNANINIIESITVDVLIGSSQSFSNTNNSKFKVNENFINSINVKIYDEYGYLVDFNNVDWFLSIGLIFSYEAQYIAPQMLDLNNNGIPDELEQTENIATA
jgi:hypothetical protein